MATKQAMRPLQRLQCDIPTLSLSSRSFQRGLTTCQRPTTTLHSARAQIKPVSSRPVLQQSFRRSYADIVTPKQKRRGRSVLRWTWRLTYLSAIGGLVYMGYGIYLLRTPQEQLEPDPTKKNLVILGETIRVQISDLPLTFLRYGMGSCISPQETRHRELQCHRHLPPQFLPLHPITTVMYDWHYRAPVHYGAHTEHSST